jgi:hypothetical protein
MTFQPVLPVGGLAGWAFLSRTIDSQMSAFAASPSLSRDSDYFRETIGTIRTAEALVTDRRLLSVALGAFGLQDDLPNRALIRRVLEDGTASRDALANRLSDDRYRQLSDAFGFGPGQGLQTLRPGFADQIIARFERQSFEIAIGQADPAMRIALSGQRELLRIAGETANTDAQWFKILSLPPLRKKMEVALGLPGSIGQIDIDKQRDIFQDRARRQFGTDDLAELTRPDTMRRITEAYLVRQQIAAGQTSLSGAAAALTLLAQAGGGRG